MADEDHVEVAIIDRTIYLKPFGFATQRNSLGIPDFVHAMFRAGCVCLALDLSACKGMDSTFLGVVADAATTGRRTVGKAVAVLNADECLLKQLRRVGLLPLICVHEGKAEPPADLTLRPIDFVHFPKSEYQRLQTVKRLHEELTCLNEGNRRLFGPFVAMLEEELHLQRKQGPHR